MYRRAALFGYVRRYGVQSRGDDARPGESYSGHGAVAWPILKQGSFEGEGEWLTGASPGEPEGAVDGGPYGVQSQAWRRPVPVCPTALEWLQQCMAWCCRDGDGRTGLTATGMALPPA
jgi:hypothetical protein